MFNGNGINVKIPRLQLLQWVKDAASNKATHLQTRLDQYIGKFANVDDAYRMLPILARSGSGGYAALSSATQAMAQHEQQELATLARTARQLQNEVSELRHMAIGLDAATDETVTIPLSAVHDMAPDGIAGEEED